MFGYPCGFVNGNLFGGIFEDRVMVRLPEDSRLPGAEPFMPMPGRPMKGYVELPKPATAKPAQMRKWLAEAHAYTATLPAKPAKKKPATR
jgi:TfoX/Sxy family transcriptional regulator of competence genes